MKIETLTIANGLDEGKFEIPTNPQEKAIEAIIKINYSKIKFFCVCIFFYCFLVILQEA